MASIIHQYIRDVSFEIIEYNFLLSDNKQATLDLDLNISSKPVQQYFEVSVKITINSKTENNTSLFIIEIEQCSLVDIDDLKDDQLKSLLFVDVPHVMFPQLRQIINNLIQESGFPSVWLQPPNFFELYKQKKFTFIH